jgi:hypothetical protein
VSCPAYRHDRRAFIGLLGIGLAATIAACSTSSPAPAPVAAQPLPPIPPPHPGASTTISRGIAGTNKICLTVDDGYCVDCVSGYVDFVRRSGIHLTFSPNGTYSHCWAPHADVIRPLLERRQVQIINHTCAFCGSVDWVVLSPWRLASWARFGLLHHPDPVLCSTISGGCQGGKDALTTPRNR